MNDINIQEEILENALFSVIQIGQVATISRTLTMQDIQAFAAVSGDTNPTHLDPEFADQENLDGVVGHSMWTGSQISTLLGTRFPGPGTKYLSQSFKFKRAIHVNDTAITTVNSLRATLGAVQSRFENTISNLRIAMENQSASRGRILDADFAVETASLSRAQILQQAGVAMISQANQLPQSVLSLIR